MTNFDFLLPTPDFSPSSNRPTNRNLKFSRALKSSKH